MTLIELKTCLSTLLEWRAKCPTGSRIRRINTIHSLTIIREIKQQLKRI